ncbi:hypothetical protein E2C01_088708 [Portunus trituberculatus]|uniref:Uncharacterized protein n=1 Tax=Portunus trituberculatus TaxID=210409 RepID=A0A5B7JML7_PORTR|nr:hypothetical protein [Portunus trituberculatus]
MLTLPPITFNTTFLISPHPSYSTTLPYLVTTILHYLSSLLRLPTRTQEAKTAPPSPKGSPRGVLARYTEAIYELINESVLMKSVMIEMNVALFLAV